MSDLDATIEFRVPSDVKDAIPDEINISQLLRRYLYDELQSEDGDVAKHARLERSKQQSQEIFQVANAYQTYRQKTHDLQDNETKETIGRAIIDTLEAQKDITDNERTQNMIEEQISKIQNDYSRIT